MQASYVMYGNTKSVMNMSQVDQFELWKSVTKGPIRWISHPSCPFNCVVRHHSTVSVLSLGFRASTVEVIVERVVAESRKRICPLLTSFAIAGDLENFDHISTRLRPGSSSMAGRLPLRRATSGEGETDSKSISSLGM